MNNIVRKWIDTFQLNDITHEPLHYHMCNQLLSKFRGITSDTLTDYCNEKEIDKRVSSRTQKLSKDIDEVRCEHNTLLEERDNLTYTVRSNETHITRLQEELKVCHHKLLEDKLHSTALTQAEVSKIESRNTEVVEILKSQLNDIKAHYESQILDLKKDKETLTLCVNEQQTSSYGLGVMGEDKLLEILQESGEFNVHDTHKENHKGDVVISRNNKSYCLDSKNYTSNVRRDEVSKLIKDIELNKFDGGAIISWNSGIYDPFSKSRIKQQIYYKMISSKPVLFISRANEISREALISLLMNLEDHVLSNPTFKTDRRTYDELKQRLITLAKEELKKIASRQTSLTKQLNNSKTEQHYWTDVLSSVTKEDILPSGDPDTEGQLPPSDHATKKDQLPYTDDIITDIPLLLNHISDSSLEQRNSTKDILTYLQTYCKFHKHKLTNEINKLSSTTLKDILHKCSYISECKHGYSYRNRVRPKSSSTWGIGLPSNLNNH